MEKTTQLKHVPIKKVLITPSGPPEDGHGDSMLSANRSAGRDVFIVHAKDPGTVLGGLRRNKGMTHTLLYTIVDTICTTSSAYVLRHARRDILSRDSRQPLRPGKYYIVTQGSVAPTPETPLFRIGSPPGTPREQAVRAFEDAVRRRDRMCAITGEETQDEERGDTAGFGVAHVFPLAQEAHWRAHDFGRFVSAPPAQGGTTHSVQNGMLLRSDLRELFDAYCLAVNPDDSHRVIVFNADCMRVSGFLLEQAFLAHPLRPPDALLRWHFRQAVLANVKGTGIAVLESDARLLAEV